MDQVCLLQQAGMQACQTRAQAAQAVLRHGQQNDLVQLRRPL